MVIMAFVVFRFGLKGQSEWAFFIIAVNDDLSSILTFLVAVFIQRGYEIS